MENKKYENLSREDRVLLELIHQSHITIDDIRWLKNKKRFKRYVNKYSKALLKKYSYKEEVNTKVKKEDLTDNELEVLDFTKTISLPSSEVLEMFEFAKNLNIKDTDDFDEITTLIKEKLKREQIIWSAVLITCILVFVSVGVYLISWQLENNKTKNLVKKMQEVAKEDKKVETTTTISANKDEEVPREVQNIDFNKLLQMNSDTKGWINVPGTNIDYAFVQTNDNEYYLNHSFDKSYNKKGWVFLDYRNDIDNLKDNTILYAHGLLNKVMFGTLKKVVTPEWYNNKDNRKILITTPKGYYYWEVFSTYTIEPESYYIITRFENDGAYKKFLNIIKSRSVTDYKVDVTTKDKILTLSSCYDHTKRVVLHAKLISKSIN